MKFRQASCSRNKISSGSITPVCWDMMTLPLLPEASKPFVRQEQVTAEATAKEVISEDTPLQRPYFRISTAQVRQNMVALLPGGALWHRALYMP